MFIPRSNYAQAYSHLKANAHPSTPSILLLCALDTDSLCGTRILTHLLKRDFIPHKLHPVAGYADLKKISETLIQGNSDIRFVICLGLGGMTDLSELGWGEDDSDVEYWVIDSRRPWHLGIVFGGGGKVTGGRYGLGPKGGIKVWDDGDIEMELGRQRDSYLELLKMPEIDSDDDDDSDSDGESDLDEEPGLGVEKLVDDLVEESEAEDGSRRTSKKRKSSEGVAHSDGESEDSSRTRRRRLDDDEDSIHPSSPPPVHRHTLLSIPSSRPIGSSPPPLGSPRTSPSPEVPLPALPTKKLRRRLLRLRKKHLAVMANYYSLGTWYGEPVSTIMYSLASELGREDNDLLWLAIVGVSSNELYGRRITSMKDTSPAREKAILLLLRDEVRRLNPPALVDSGSAAPTSTSLHAIAKGPNDKSIRLSPEFRFMLIRHWSLYESMLHSSYLGTKLRLYSELGKKKLHKLLAKMGFSLAQSKQTYTHMDIDLKRTLREKIQSVAKLYGLEELVIEGFVRSWGWKAVLSAGDVGAIVSGIMEIGYEGKTVHKRAALLNKQDSKLSDLDMESQLALEEKLEKEEEEEWVSNWFGAWDALENIDLLKSALPSTLAFHRALHRTGSALLEKKEIQPMKTFRLAILKEGPDLPFFLHPSALIKLALWVAEAIYEGERETGRKHLPVVLACLNERREVYIVVGVGICKGANRLSKEKVERRAAKAREKAKAKAAKAEGVESDEEEEEDDDDESDDEDELMKHGAAAKNKFGLAFSQVAENTNARVRIDSFDACVVEIKKEDMTGFFEELSRRALIGDS